MNLSDALNRRAERGPHRHRGDVIAAAVAQHHLHISTDRVDSATSVHEIPLAALGHRPSRLRPVLVGLTAAVVAGGGIAAMAIQQTRTQNGPAAANDPSTPPVPPLELTEQQRSDAVDRCAAGDTPTSAVVDGRQSGILVGLTVEGTWRTCLHPDSSPDSTDNDATININDTSSPAPSAPLSLLPDTNPQWPITVIDAKAPDGNDINGDEMTWVWGRVDPSIKTITISTPTDRYTPTVRDGLFAAFWPGNDSDRTVVHGFDAAGNEIAFTDQLNCAALESVETADGLFTTMQPRVVVHGEYVGGGCLGGEDVPPGRSPDDIGD